MPRQSRAAMEELLPGKIRKRGCSSSASSSSSIIQNYRFKRAILVGKRGGSSTPVPTWKLMGTARTPSSALRAVDSPKYAASQNGGVVKGKLQQQAAPVSARKLAATLWEMNEMPSPKMKERMDRSGTGSRHRRVSSISQRLRLTDHCVGAFDSISNASLMEIDTRSRAQTPTGSTIGAKTHLKDVSNALTTSKELLKIINRVWGNEDRPSSSMSLISALHAELERARLQAAWKNKEQKVVEAAIESIAGELEVEKKLRRRLESLNKKLGKELAETKSSLLKAVKELENEKRARVVMEQVCDELARDIGEDKAEVEELKRESAKLCAEVEKEREMMQLADVLREERVHMKLSEAKYQLEEKNAAVDKLRNQLEAFIGPKRAKEKGRAAYHVNEEIAAYLNKARSLSHQNEVNEDDGGEVEDGVECEDDSADSDLHSIELNMDNNNKSYKWTYPSGTPCDLRKAAIDEEEIKGRKSTSSKAPRRSTSLQRSVSDGVEWSTQNERLSITGDGMDWGGLSELERHLQGKSYADELADEMHGYQTVKGVRDYLLSSSRIDSARSYGSPTRQVGQRPLRDPNNAAQERPLQLQGMLQIKTRRGH
ncbi:hypothetical protein GH714_030716 [Hevea brasiliensis]|uniref:Uncharacterized protein n=1 Tax=Hevea brasiliensis TaxID=3981 RepID=A0A6A6M1U8_HEVBR|nr:hypothetical protein GH714_030716 [Hevea brasiliensis]